MSMVFFLDEDGETRISLDSETQVTVNMPSTVSQTSNMSGSTVSDDVIEGNITISVSGLVTYAKMESQSSNLDPLAFQKAIQVARRNRRKFTLYYKDTGQPLLQSYTNCVIENCNLLVDRFSDTITVDMTFQQIFVSAAATTTTLTTIVKESDKPTVSGTVDGGSSTSTENTDAENTTILYSMGLGAGAEPDATEITLDYLQNKAESAEVE